MPAVTPTSLGSAVHLDLLRALLGATQDFVFVKDLEGRYVAINDMGAANLGLTVEQIVGHTDFEFVPRELALEWTREDRSVLTAGKPRTFEHELRLPGRTACLETVKSPWRNEHGEIIGVVGISRDVTEKKQVEAELRQVQSRFGKLFSSDLLGILIPDRFGAITEANDHFLRIVGYTREDLEAGKVRWDTMTPPELVELDRMHIAEAAEHGECTPYEKEYIRKDGTRVPIMCGYTLLNGSQDQYIAFIQDMSAVKKAEEALRQAEKLTTASRFAASMAHEINNPLASVTNLIYLASRQTSLDTITRSLLEEADRELSRISQIVGQSLRFHRQNTSPGPCDIGQIMDSVFPLFKSRLSDRHISLHRDYTSDMSLLGYNSELRHAFANIIGNALDATPDGGSIHVRVKSGFRWNGTRRHGITVTIADTGCGIPAAVRTRLFEPFVSTKEQTGTGLGLWAAKSIVQKHCGHISVRSTTATDRTGTVFSVFLPFDGIPTVVSAPGTD